MPREADGRQRIIDATIETIRDEGLAAIRIQELARRAGTSPALVVYHFGTVYGAVAAAMEESEDAYFDELDSSNAEHSTAPELLRNMVDRSSDPDAGLGTWKLWMELWVHALRDERAASLRQRLDDRWRKQLTGVIEQGIAEGHFSSADTRASMLRMAALLDGLSIAAALNDLEILPSSVPPLWLELVAQELNCDRTKFGL